MSAGLIGNDKFMTRLSLQGNIKDWIGRYYKNDKIDLAYPRPVKDDIDHTKPKSIPFLYIKTNEHKTYAELEIETNDHTTLHIGRAVRHLANISEPETETIELALYNQHLKGPAFKFLRKDIEDSLIHHTKSPEEIWHNTIITKYNPNHRKLDASKIPKYVRPRLNQLHFMLQNKLSLSEDTSGILYRSSLGLKVQKSLPFGIITGATAKVNLADNLNRLSSTRPAALRPTRGDEQVFASQRFALDRLYGSWLGSLTSELHASISSGFLEEMYFGTGGEILYRPWQKTYGIGAELWRVQKRSPLTTFRSSYPEAITTGHLNFWYEVPDSNVTAFTKIGRYLAEDYGATLGLQTRFDNGAELKGFVTGTNRIDTNLFGGTSHFYSGVEFKLPLGNIPYVPRGSHIETKFEPMARNAGQSLDNPLPLYELTEPLSYRRIVQSWPDLLN